MDVVNTVPTEATLAVEEPLEHSSDNDRLRFGHPDDDELPASEDVPDWRHIQLLRLRAKEASKAVQEIRSLHEELASLKKRQRSASPEPVQSPPMSPHRIRKDSKRVHSRDIPESRQLSYIQLKRAIAGCLARYDCTDKQRVSILYAQAELIKNKY